MGKYFKTVYLYGFTTFMRMVRDPLTTLIFFGIPILLLVIFGLLVRGENNINLRSALINHSDTTLSQEFEQTIRDSGAFQIDNELTTLNDAKQAMSDDDLDAIIELPAAFGQTNPQGISGGDVNVYLDETDAQTSDIAQTIVNGIIDGYNRKLMQSNPPINAQIQSVNGNNTQPIQHLFAIFTGLSMIMLGVLGIGTVMPQDKKAQILRRFRVTPIKKSQVVLGTGGAFFVLGTIIMAIMVATALLLFDMNMNGDWATFVGFMLFGLVTMLGLGLALGAVVKNPTQGQGAGQIIFLGSLAVSGVWIPLAAMPAFLQNIATYMPLTPVIEGIRNITMEGASFSSLLPEIIVMIVWIVIAYGISFRIFRWE